MEVSEIQNSSRSLIGSGAKWGESRRAHWNGFSYEWRELGSESNKTIVLVHGFGASSSHWRHIAPLLASEGFKVYAIDLIGFGNSEQPHPKKIAKLDNEFWSMQLKDFLDKIVQSNSNRKVTLIGNSLGSLVSITTQAHHGDIVESVIASPLPDPALVNKANNFNNKQSKIISLIKDVSINIFFKILPLEIFLPIISRSLLFIIGLQAAYVKSIKSDLELQKIVSTPAKRKTAARALRAMCIGMALRRKEITAPQLLYQIAANISQPKILLIWGREDKFVPLLIAERLVEQHPWLKLKVFDNNGHCPHDESPALFNKNVLEWLEISSINA